MENNLRANLPGHQTLAKLRPLLKKTALLERNWSRRPHK
jgi:hypothetical protein